MNLKQMGHCVELMAATSQLMITFTVGIYILRANFSVKIFPSVVIVWNFGVVLAAGPLFAFAHQNAFFAPVNLFHMNMSAVIVVILFRVAHS